MPVCHDKWSGGGNQKSASTEHTPIKIHWVILQNTSSYRFSPAAVLRLFATLSENDGFGLTDRRCASRMEPRGYQCRLLPDFRTCETSLVTPFEATIAKRLPPMTVVPSKSPHGVRLLTVLVLAGAGLGLPAGEINDVHAAEANIHSICTPVGFADVVAKVKPAVIAVTVKVVDDTDTTGSEANEPSSERPFSENSPLHHYFFGSPEQQSPHGHPMETALGSGFFISADGYAVTNAHVVQHGLSFEIATDDGRISTAKVIGVDLRTDVALLKVEGRNDFPYVTFADEEPRVGDWIIAVGNPYGLGGTVTAGIVSARGRRLGVDTYDDFIQIDAPINKGNSGGPTFNPRGEVIGVNTAIFSPSGGSVGIGFAIPAQTVKSVVEQLRSKGTVTRGALGVEAQPLTAELADALGLRNDTGALVAQVEPDGPASKGGITPGDVITSINGQEIATPAELASKVGATQPGTVVRVGINRGGQAESLTVTLGELPSTPFKTPAPPTNRERHGGLGLSLAPARTVEGAGDNGVIVTQVDPNGEAVARGLAAGDVILDVAGTAVNTPAEVRDALKKAGEGGKREVLLRVRSGQRTGFVAVPVDSSHQTLWGKIQSWLRSL
jgi:serine protease Do